MKLGLFTPVLGGLNVTEMLAKVRALGSIQAIELGTGGWPGHDHIDPDQLLASGSNAREYRQMVADAGLTISALSCHGNPLHPNSSKAKADDEVYRKTVRLAERLEVPVVVTFSGCPGDSDEATHPNWVTTAWPPEFLDILDWQREKKLIPYWTEAAGFAADHGVIDAKNYRRMAERSWLFRTVGWGHGELEWKRIVSALRLAGYNYVMSIEHEDAFASVDEGLRSAIDLLARVMLTERPPDPWWT